MSRAAGAAARAGARAPAIQPVATGSSVQVVTSTASATADESVRVTATVTADATDVVPSGSVTFTDDGADIAGCAAVPLSAGGQSATVTCQAAFAPPQAQLAATFAPSADSAVLGSTSPTVTLPVAHVPVRIALHTVTRMMAGTRTTDTARLTIPAQLSGSPLPTGTVTFLDHGKPIPGCARRPVSRLVATCSVTYYLAGRHAITAAYAADPTFAAARSATASLTVSPIAVTGRIAATMKWTFYFTPTYTEVVRIALDGVADGSTVQVGCHGTGCPFVTRRHLLVAPRCATTQPATCATSTGLSLTPDLAGDKLGIGAQLTVSISHPNDVGKYYSFIVRARVQPAVRIACLAPASPLPGAGCTLVSPPAG
ncbi:MAG TPA: Ig-like domain-containing protein [Solirubrobacteraceae bacterium]|nr:Ig-like domain-containing protein [Solirubrobacteraceae bacterium]